MSTQRTDIDRLESLLDLAAESILSASDDEMLNVFSEAEIDPSQVEYNVDRLISGAIKNRRKNYLATAKTAYESLKKWVATLVSQTQLPEDSDARHALERMIAQPSDSWKSVTLAFRNKTAMSDDDAAGILEDLTVLNRLGGDRNRNWAWTFHSWSADQLLHQLDITEPREIDVEAIAYYCGAIVTYRALQNSAARIIGTEDRAIISVDSSSSRGRQRFSVAHELGHWMLHHGKVAYLCDDRDLSSPWEFRQDPESRANEFAAELLLPRSLFKATTENRDVTFKTVSELADIFQTSLTATAIRLVQLASSPAMVICYGQEGRRWYARGPNISASIFPKMELGHETAAFELLFGNTRQSRPLPSKAKEWITHRYAYQTTVVEDSIKIGNDSVLTLIWWKDRSQLSRLEE